MNLSDKMKNSYTVEDLEEGLYTGKDVRETVLKLMERIRERRVNFEVISFIKEEFGDKLTKEVRG